MATTDKNVKNPIINVLTKSQFDGITSPSADEFYLITDDSPIIAGTGLTASVSNGLTLLDHSNSITPVTTQALYPITIDAQGHITSVGTATTGGSSYTHPAATAHAAAAVKVGNDALGHVVIGDALTIANHTLTYATGAITQSKNVTTSTTSIYQITGVGSLPTLGTAFTIPNITKKTVVVSATVSDEVLTISTGDSVTTGTAFTVPNVTGVGSLPTRSQVTVATGISQQPTFTLTTTTTTLSHSIT